MSRVTAFEVSCRNASPTALLQRRTPQPVRPKTNENESAHCKVTTLSAFILGVQLVRASRHGAPHHFYGRENDFYQATGSLFRCWLLYAWHYANAPTSTDATGKAVITNFDITPAGIPGNDDQAAMASSRLLPRSSIQCYVLHTLRTQARA
ncbi:hypothetical protein F5888DRAFT_1669501 [Russula emetica]|nr:hypothetical protein F5888DRAFT_1669501 [Russula emetica]